MTISTALNFWVEIKNFIRYKLTRTYTNANEINEHRWHCDALYKEILLEFHIPLRSQTKHWTFWCSPSAPIDGAYSVTNELFVEYEVICLVPLFFYDFDTVHWIHTFVVVLVVVVVVIWMQKSLNLFAVCIDFSNNNSDSQKCDITKVSRNISYCFEKWKHTHTQNATRCERRHFKK